MTLFPGSLLENHNSVNNLSWAISKARSMRASATPRNEYMQKSLLPPALTLPYWIGRQGLKSLWLMPSGSIIYGPLDFLSEGGWWWWWSRRLEWWLWSIQVNHLTCLILMIMITHAIRVNHLWANWLPVWSTVSCWLFADPGSHIDHRRQNQINVVYQFSKVALLPCKPILQIRTNSPNAG